METAQISITPDIKEKIISFQRNEITEHNIYINLAQTAKRPEHKALLLRIADEELRHYHIWKQYSGEEISPNRLSVWIYSLIGRVLGLTFGIKLMENGEENAQDNYSSLIGVIPEAEMLANEEQQHENELINSIDEEALRYVGSVVLGLNDALVELTGALAGFTLALQNTKLIAMTGAITGIAAALSMAASEFLSTRSEHDAEESTKSPYKASLYTGYAYITTVLLLILPYLIFESPYRCLGVSLTIAVIIIAVFNYYISIAKDLSFKHRFLEMTGVSFSVSGLSFLIGYLFRILFGVDV